MRIAINTRFLLRGHLEGIGRYTWEVAQRMALKHPEDQFYFFFDRPFDPAFRIAPNIIPVVLFPPARHPFLFIWWFEISVARALRRYKIDVFLSPDHFLSLRSRTPALLVIHDLAYLHYPDHVGGLVRWYYRICMPRFIRKAGHILAVSEYTRRDILRHFDLPAAKISVAPNGCRAAFAPMDKVEVAGYRSAHTSGKAYFLYIGAIHPRKNIPRLIEAFDHFKSRSGSDCLLLLAGRFAWDTGPVRTAYENAVHRDHIHFLGYVPDEALPPLMAAAQALVNVSLFEGFGVPVLEAMHSDVPVLISDRASLPEVAGDAGWQVNPEDITAIAEGMYRLNSDEPLRQKLIEAGREQSQQFDWDKTADIVYQQVQSLFSQCS